MRHLTQEQVEELHQCALQLLAETGVAVQHEVLLGRAAAAGAVVDAAGGRLRIPPQLLEETVAQAPRSYAIGGAGGFARTVGAGPPQCVAIVTDPWIVEYGSGDLRHPRLADVRRHTRIAQSLDEVAAISLMDYPVADVEGPQSNLHALREHMLHHSKHIYVLAASLESLNRYVRIAEVLGEEEPGNGPPLMTAGVAVKSPLTLSRMNGDLLVSACQRGLPVVPTVCPMAGTTAPYSRAAVLVQAHAENLFVAALTQWLRPGHPFLYAQGPSVTDLSSGEDRYYTLDKVLWKMAGVQLGRRCGLPSTAECGGTMSAAHDPQAGAEGMLFMEAAYESGADVLAGIGSCGNAVAMSAEHMVLQTLWLDMARYLADGIQVAGRTGMASLRRVGPGGHFMDDDLTVELMRAGEFFHHELLPAGQGGESLMDRAHARAARLAARTEPPLASPVREGLERLFRDEFGLPPS